MSHIHELIDFVVNIFIIHENRVLLIYHKELRKWLPVGGHIELDEGPEEAIFREAEEETGLKNIKILSQKPELKFEGTKFLYPPTFLDIHNISENHKHIALNYFAKTKSNKVRLAKKEHQEIRWFTKKEIDSPKFNIQSSIKFYAKQAFKRYL